LTEGVPAIAHEGYTIRVAEQNGDACKLVDVDRVKTLLRSRRTLSWINVVVTDVDAGTRLLMDEFGFHKLAAEDALSDKERPTLQEFEDYIFFAMPSVVESGDDTSFIEIGFFLLHSALVTVSMRSCPTVELWFDRWCEHPKRLGISSAMLTHAVVDGIVDSYFPVLDHIEDRLDELSDQIFSGDTTKVKQVLMLKKQLLEFRRRIIPLRDVVNQLLRNDLDLIPLKTKVYFQDVYDHLMRLYDSLDVNRETLASLLDVHLSQVSNNLNEVVKKMTVFATVLMIMTLITSLYGMNVGLPGQQGAAAFVWIIVAMFGSGVLTWLGFRAVKWI
jgi:magnesium transporter